MNAGGLGFRVWCSLQRWCPANFEELLWSKVNSLAFCEECVVCKIHLESEREGGSRGGT